MSLRNICAATTLAALVIAPLHAFATATEHGAAAATSQAPETKVAPGGIVDFGLSGPSKAPEIKVAPRSSPNSPDIG